jgi:FkbM family methyltransferase
VHNKYDRFKEMKIIRNSILRRLSKIPRYIPGEIILDKKRFKYCDSVTFINGYNEIFKEEVYAFNTNNKSPYIIDCGSNIGMSIFYYKQKFPDCRILAFEADQKIFGYLEHNISEFGLEGVTLINSAVWIADGFIKFYNEGGYSGRILKNGDPETSTITSVCLSNFLNAKVDFLKMDIEGAESAVLKSIENKLHLIDKLFLEYHSHISEKQDLDSILNILSKNGFRYFIREAYVSRHPFIEISPLAGMDLQLNIYAIKDQK